MRFSLNGVDLGTAFLNFTGPEIFPAMSLNVRQSVRINFGQYRFQYPPDEIDGKAYQAVWLASDYPREKGLGVKEDMGTGLTIDPLGGDILGDVTRMGSSGTGGGGAGSGLG